MEKGIFRRIFIAVFLLVILVALFIFEETEKKKMPRQDINTEAIDTFNNIDSVIESVLAKFDIQENWIKRVEFKIPGTQKTRIERRVQIPPEIIPAIVNLELSRAVKNFNMTVSASENLKENIVTIHIHNENIIIQSIILKTNKNLKGKESLYQLKKS